MHAISNTDSIISVSVCTKFSRIHLFSMEEKEGEENGRCEGQKKVPYQHSFSSTFSPVQDQLLQLHSGRVVSFASFLITTRVAKYNQH